MLNNSCNVRLCQCACFVLQLEPFRTMLSQENKRKLCRISYLLLLVLVILLLKTYCFGLRGIHRLIFYSLFPFVGKVSLHHIKSLL